MGMANVMARWVVIVLVVGLMPVPPLAASPGVLPADQITMGMTGIGKTVILGTKISEFQVQVLGILKNAGPAGDLVLFRGSGPAIEAVGGLAAGMSGSPIYLRGRLAGAFSFAFQFADPTMGLFTPIEDMLKVIPDQNAAPRRGVYPVSPFSLGGRIIRRVALRVSPSLQPVPDDTVVAFPAATPLFVTGLGPAATEEMAQALRPMGLIPMAGAGTASLPPTIPLEGGSAIGISLMQGDLTAYTIGTLSYRDGNRILALGHPFTELGKTEFLMTNATIFQTVRGLNHNIKIGAAGAPVGIISEDRPAAVGGTLGVLPRMFGVRVRVQDSDAGTAQLFRFQVVYSKDLAPILVALGTRGAVERALNRSGEGTAEVRMILRGRSLPRRVERANIFYSGSDIAVQALSEVPQALHLLFDNDFVDVGPSDIEVDVRTTKVRQTGTITEAEMPRGQLVPGATLRVRVTVRPFREAPVTRNVELVVPQDFPVGSAVLTVRGGGASLTPPGLGGTSGLGQGPAAIQNLTDAISAFEGGEKNTDVVVELMSAAPRTPPPGDTAGSNRVSIRWTTPWVLGGRFQTPVTISRGSR
jgi:hypothetical protein